MSKFKTEKLDTSSWSLWDDFVSRTETGTLFHTSTWMQVLGYQPEITVVSNAQGNIVGGINLVLTRKFGFRAGHIPPYTPYFGPVIQDRVPGKSLASAQGEEQEILSVLLRSLQDFPHVDFILHPDENRVLPYLWKGYTFSLRPTYMISGPPGEMLGRMKKTTRNRIRKLSKLELSADIVSSLSDTGSREFLDIVSRNSKKRHFNARIKLLEKIMSNLPSGNRFVTDLRTRDGNFLAGDLFVQDEKQVYYIAGAKSPSLSGYLKDCHLFTLYKGILKTLEMQKRFDFEGSKIPGIADFFRSMGGELTLCHRVCRSKSLYFFSLRMLKLLVHEQRVKD